MTDTQPREPVGVVLYTSSLGHFDLVLYADGILGVKGTYSGALMRAVTSGFGIAQQRRFTIGAQEGKLLARLREHPRSELATLERRNFFLPRESLRGIVLHKHWYRQSVTLVTGQENAHRTFSWRPELNSFDAVRRCLLTNYPELLHIV